VASFLASPAEPKVRYAFLDDPNVLMIVASLQPGESAEPAAARLRAFVKKSVNDEWRSSEPVDAKRNLAIFFSTSPLPDQALANNVYGVAFGLGRCHQLGLSGKLLSNKLDRATADDIQRVGEQYFSPGQGAVSAVLIKPP
jgi:hypothetical protein